MSSNRDACEICGELIKARGLASHRKACARKDRWRREEKGLRAKMRKSMRLLQYIFDSDSLADPSIEFTNQSNVKLHKPSLREPNGLEVGGVRSLFYSFTKF